MSLAGETKWQLRHSRHNLLSHSLLFFYKSGYFHHCKIRPVSGWANVTPFSAVDYKGMDRSYIIYKQNIELFSGMQKGQRPISYTYRLPSLQTRAFIRVHFCVINIYGLTVLLLSIVGSVCREN